jgi:hypothetical protein
VTYLLSSVIKKLYLFSSIYHTIIMKYFASVDCVVVILPTNFIWLSWFLFFPAVRSRQPVGSLLAPLALGLGRDYVVPATTFTKSPRTPKSADGQTNKQTDKKGFRLALAIAIGTSKYYLPKVLRLLPTYLLLSI